MNNKLSSIFEIISFYDDFRWKNKNNNSLINFFKNDIDNDTKILTHWLCYITDRQMPYKIIWDVGGFVFSELINEIKTTRNINLLNPRESSSFIKKEGQSEKYYFISKSDANSLVNENYNNYIMDKKTVFKSRFLPSDYLCILYTFISLEDFDYKLSKFIANIYLKNKNTNDLIRKILFSLYLLTYFDIGQPTSADIFDFKKNLKKAYCRKEEIFSIINDTYKFESEFQKFNNDKIFNQKRAWCSLRDFFKSIEFNSNFKLSLIDCGINQSDFNNLFNLNCLYQFELPGDVWNNNSKFRDCILKNTEYENSKKSLNIILRDHFEKNKDEIIGYPEQFDITFNFVPRMCEENNCDVCPIYKLTYNNNFDELCINNVEKLCPVALVGCNYKILCIGKNNCKLNTRNKRENKE